MRTKPPIEWSRPLIFAWPSSQPFYFILPSMIFVATVLHFLALGLVHLIYPPPGDSRLAPATVVVLPSDMSFWKNQSLWIDAADPSLFSSARVDQSTDVNTGQTIFQPSYLGGSLNWWAPEESAALPSTSAPPLRAVSIRPAPTPSPSLPVPRVEGVLRIRGTPSIALPLPPDLEKLSLPSAAALFLVEVGPDGIPQHVFLESSSGSAEWDSAAEGALRNVALPDRVHSSWIRLSLGADNFLPLENMQDAPSVLP